MSNLLLGGLINIKNQHDTIDEMSNRMKAVEESSLTDKIRLEALESWVLKQSEEIKNQGDKLDKLDKVNEVKNKKKEDVEIQGTGKTIFLDCKHCDLKFTKACQLEQHLEDHGVERNHSCDVCEKHFHLKWRLQKHLQLHSPASSAHFCHYYNNSKACPFSTIGCMFRHKMAGRCKVSNCSRKLCEFEHSDTSVHDNANEEIITCESEVDEEEDSSIEYGENDCHLCTYKSKLSR